MTARRCTGGCGIVPAMSTHPTDSSVIRDLIGLVETKALRRGTFRLASGREASFYLDAKQVVLDAHGAMLVGRAILDRLRALGPLPDAVGGMSIGADPITSAVVTMAGVEGLPLKGFMVRKEPKDHGTKKYVEGPVQPGQRVVIVDDLLATGGTALATTHLVRQLKAEPVATLFVIELLGLHGREKLAPMPVHALMSMEVDE